MCQIRRTASLRRIDGPRAPERREAARSARWHPDLVTSAGPTQQAGATLVEQATTRRYAACTAAATTMTASATGVAALIASMVRPPGRPARGVAAKEPVCREVIAQTRAPRAEVR